MNKIVYFTYRNYKGKESRRRVKVDSIEFIRDPGFGYQPGWFLSGMDLDKNARRSFAFSSMIISDELIFRINL